MMWMVALAGCQKPPVPVSKGTQSVSLKPVEMIRPGFTVKGRIQWKGDLPQIEGFHAPYSPLSEHAGKPKFHWQNPCAPKIDPQSKGVQSAVVFLNNAPRIDTFSLDPVKVVTDKFQMVVQQGGQESRFGFVKPDEPFQIINQQDFFFTVRGRGDAFFSIPLITKNQPCQKKTGKPGLVTLTSGSGQFWMRSYLFSVEHPWVSRCDEMGTFEIHNLPEGRHELSAWLPNWNVVDREIDAETWEINRLEFAPPLQKRFVVEVNGSAQGGVVIVEISEGDFSKKPL